LVFAGRSAEGPIKHHKYSSRSNQSLKARSSKSKMKKASASKRGSKIAQTVAPAPTTDESAAPKTSPAMPSEKICDALVSSAQANGLPLAFFSNLIWQESRLSTTTVSRAGAQGIAQFMPSTAARVGLHNPFDPLQALPASAHLLATLVHKYGNLGLAAAAYNAGDGRVDAWLNRGAVLPAETRNYVLTITGRTIEQWPASNAADASISLVKRMPCLNVQTFATAAAMEDETIPAAAPAAAATATPVTIAMNSKTSKKADRETRSRSAAPAAAKPIGHKPIRLAQLSASPRSKAKLDAHQKSGKSHVLSSRHARA
jgi:hypothetical protein